MTERLTAKEQRFIDEYIVCLNGTEAAVRAGYGGERSSAASIAWRLLRKVKISRVINERLESLAMPANEVLAQVTDISRNDMGDMLNSMGAIDISEAMRRGKTNQIKRYKSKVTTITEKDGTEREIIETEIELYDRQGALNTLAKYHDLTNTIKVEDWHSEIIQLYRDGTLSLEQAKEELGEEIAQELLISAGISVTPSGEG
jgi:phage terminase small subunit